MDDYDRENLFFLLNASEEVLRDWYNNVGPDDHDYASELLAEYSKELELKTMFYLVEEVDLSNLTQDAESYLKKFSLGNKE